jgi:hypothetical protein
MNEGHFAVIVGINRYPGLPTSLNHAKRDAQDFYEWLIEPTGGAVPEENVRLVVVDDDEAEGFTDNLSSHPTIDEINNEISRVNVAARALVDGQPDLWDDTRLYLYASGHGIAPGSGVGALLSATSALSKYEARLDNLEFQSYCDWYLHTGIFHEVVLFSDCCREHRPLTRPGGPPFEPIVTGRSPVFCTVGFAAELGESGYEPDDEKGADTLRGYFTRALMDGLRGGAADRETGEISTDTLAEYVVTSVEWQLKGLPFNQNPRITGELGRPPIVLRAAELGPLPPRTRTMTLCVSSDAPDELVLYRRAEPTPHRFARGAGTVKLELPEDVYQVRAADGSEIPTLPEKGSFRVIAEDRNVDL